VSLLYTASNGCGAVQTDACGGEGRMVRTRVRENQALNIVVDGLGAGDEGDFELYLQFSYELAGGETCASAPSLNALARRGRIVGDNSNAVHQTDPRDYDNCTGQPGPGMDLVYAVTLQPGETLTADYGYTAFVDNRELRGFLLGRGPSFYVLDGCAETGALEVRCVDGSDNPDVTFEERVVVRNDGALAHTYYLVLDETSANSGGAAFDLSWVIQ
jgi:hypothetical protein